MAAAAVVGTMLLVPAILGDAPEKPVQAIELGLGQPNCEAAGECDPPPLVYEDPSPSSHSSASAQAKTTQGSTSATRQRRKAASSTTAGSPATSPSATSQPPSAGGVIVRVRNARNLLLGFRGQVTIQNTSSDPVNGWVLTFFYDDVRITMTSGADGTYDSDGRFRATPREHNRVIRPRDSVGFQFEATGNPDARPTGCLLNGHPCTFG